MCVCVCARISRDDEKGSNAARMTARCEHIPGMGNTAVQMALFAIKV